MSERPGPSIVVRRYVAKYPSVMVQVLICHDGTRYFRQPGAADLALERAEAANSILKHRRGCRKVGGVFRLVRTPKHILEEEGVLDGTFALEAPPDAH